jgi:hypothetical protein
MKRWTDIQEAVKGEAPAARMRSASLFWDDFRARAPMYPRNAPGPAHASPLLRWSLATACAVLVLTGVTVHSLRSGQGVYGNAITALDIAAPHRAVFIMNDNTSGGTILWIDCDAADQPVEGGVL